MKTKQAHVPTRSEIEHRIQLKEVEIVNYREIAESYPGSSLWKPGHRARLKAELNHLKRLLKKMNG